LYSLNNYNDDDEILDHRDKAMLIGHDENASTNECDAEKEQNVIEPQEHHHQCRSFGNHEVTAGKQVSRFSAISEMFKWTKGPISANGPAAVAATNARIVEGDANVQILPQNNTDIACRNSIASQSKRDCQYYHCAAASQVSESVQHHSAIERDRLLNLVSDMQQQVIDLSHDRDALIIQRDDAAMHSKRYKKDMSTLEWQMQAALQMVQEVQEAMVVKEEEANEFRESLQSKDAAYAKLQSLLSKNDQEFAVDMSSMANKVEEEWNVKLASVHNQHLEELERIINDLNKRHSDDITRVKCELRTSHREEIDLLRLVEEMRYELLSSSGAAEIARVRSEANKEHLNEIERLRTEMQASSALALEGQAPELSLSHAVALKEPRAELQAPYSSELVRVESEANRQYSDGIGSVHEISGESVISHGETLSEEYEGSCGNGEIYPENEMDSQVDEDSFYIGHDEGFLAFDSVDESDLSETASETDDDNGDDDGTKSHLESYIIDTSLVLGEVDERECVHTMEESYGQLSQCENEQLIQLRSELQLSLVVIERIQKEMEHLKLNHVEELHQVAAAHRQDFERIRHAAKAKGSQLLVTEMENAMRLEDVTLERDELANRLASTQEEVSTYIANVPKALSIERDTAIEIFEIEQVLLSLTSEKDELSSSLEQTKAEVFRLETEKEESIASFNCLQEDIIDLKGRNKSLSDELNVSKAKSAQIEAAAVAEFDATASEHRRCLEDLERVTGEYDILALDLVNVEAKSKDAIDHLEESIKHQNDEAVGLHEIIYSSTAQIAELTLQFSTLTEERDELVIKLEKATLERDELANRLASNQEVVFSYSSDVSRFETSIQALSIERDTAIEKMNEMEEVLLSLTNEKDELTTSVEQTKADVFRLEADKEESVASLNCLQEDIIDLKGKNKGFKKSLDQANNYLLEKCKDDEVAALQIACLKENLLGLQKSLSDKDAQLASMCSCIQQLEQQLDSTNGDLQDMLEKVNHFQRLAGKLAVSVLKLKIIKCKQSKDQKQLVAQLETQNDKIAMLERCLDGVKADRQALAATHFHQHKKLTATTADLRKKMLEELLRKKMLDYHKTAEIAQEGLKNASEEKADLNCQIQALSEKAAILERMVSLKDDELLQFQTKVTNESEKLFELRQQGGQLIEENTSILLTNVRSKVDEQSGRTVIDHLQSENHSLKGFNTSLLMEDAAAKLQLKRANDAFAEVQAVQPSMENRLEALMQDRNHHSTEVGSMDDCRIKLEAEREWLIDSLRDYQEKTTQLSDKVALLENQAASNRDQVFRLESQLVSKVSAAGASNKTIESHRETIIKLRNQILSLDKQKADMEGLLSSLKSKMDLVIGEREDLALQLDKSITELKNIQEERNKLAAKVAEILIMRNPPDHVLNPGDISYDHLKTASHGVHVKAFPRTEITAMLNLSNVSARDANLLCERVSRAKAMFTQIKREKKLLDNEVMHLRAGLEQAQQEFKIGQVASNACTLLETTENEKNQLAVALDNAQKAMKQIQWNSSQGAYVEQSKDEVIKLNTEVSTKNKSTKSVAASKYRNDTRTGISHHSPKVTSNIRFTIEKGQSMFDLLKDIKKSGRKEKLKYRRVQ
jgi:chromosome segregation ATPase